MSKTPIKTQKTPTKSAKLLYQPAGIIISLSAGLVASAIFKKVWQHATPGDPDDPPGPLESEYPINQILIAAVIQGAIFAVVKTLAKRGGAQVFEKATGEWPGS